jgi:hypothetical protein
MASSIGSSSNKQKKRCLSDGSQGVTHRIPPGDLVSCCDGDGDEDLGLTVHDIPGRLQWSLKFFENLHMDISPSQEDHRRKGMERCVLLRPSVVSMKTK